MKLIIYIVESITYIISFIMLWILNLNKQIQIQNS